MRRAAKPKAYLFVARERRNGLPDVWHIARADKHTVCGRALPLSSSMFKERAPAPATKDESLCRNCDRMKDAESVRLA